jgi:hypothetical protein
LNFWFVDVFGGAKSVFAKDTTQTKAGATNDPATLLVQMFRVDIPALCLVAFLHGIRINGHGDDPRHVLGVFPTACKFNHSCAPNTCWHLLSPYQDGAAFSTGGLAKDDDSADTDGGKAQTSPRGGEGAGSNTTRLQRSTDDSAFASARHCPLWRRGLDEYLGVVQHVATRDVAAGTHFTFSYIGTGWNLLAPAFVRRGMLAHLNFCCGCGPRRRLAPYSVRSVPPRAGHGGEAAEARRGWLRGRCGPLFPDVNSAAAPGARLVLHYVRNVTAQRGA